MKFRYTQKSSSSPRKKQKKGFALIATLTLMMLLAMLAVAIMATAASQNRIALQTMLQAEARQQALVGLDAAIGELQLELGPDQRVTASSGILSKDDNGSAQHLLGVWNSWDGPIYGKSKSGHGNKITSTYDNGRSSMFRRWMISSRDRNATRTLKGADNLCRRMPGQRICLVGEGTLGKNLSAQHYVYADLLTMPSLGKNEACYAWWVGGENQKAKVSVQNPKDAEDAYEALHRTWDTPAPRFVDNRDLDFMPDTVEEPARLVTLASLPLLGTSSQAAGMPYFFDVTTTSYTLPINVSMGGFKQDLNLLLNKKTLKSTEFAARTNQDCPLVENSDLPKGTESNMPIGSWQNMHAYYHCWPDGKSDNGKNFTARLLGNLDSVYTRMSGSVFEHESLEYSKEPDDARVGTQSTNHYDTRSMLEEGSESAGYARTPVMLAFMTNFGLTTERVGETSSGKEGEAEGQYTMRMCFAPMFLWWNPYNVPMRIRGQQLWAQSAPYKTIALETYAIGGKTGNKWGWSSYAMHQSAGADGFGMDYGEYFQNSLTDTTGDIVFAPGEIVFFSPGKARSDKNAAFSNPWIPGYNSSSVSAYAANFYSNKKESEVLKGDWYVAMRLGQLTEAYQGGDNLQNRRTDGYWFAPLRPECVTVFSGYNGQEGASGASGGYGKRASSPARFLLGWYNPEENPGSWQDPADKGLVFLSKSDGRWKADGSQEDPDIPYYVASIGVVAKSANSEMDPHGLRKGDFRTKLWQHSSPAFWGGALTNPDDQMCKYHPYQLAALRVSSGMDSAPMDNIGRNGFLGITSEGEQVSFASVMELPVHPPFSLAGFAGMRLQPGWYKSEASGDYKSQGALRRMQYQAGVPGVGIGNSFADPCLPADDVYMYFQNNLEASQLASNSKLFSDFFDHGLLINDAMWDRWFCSSLSDMPTKNGVRKAEEVLQDFLAGKEELPVSRYKRVNTPYNDEQLVKRIMAEDGWKHIAQYLMIDGGFNVNSTSVEAWTATLQGLAKRKLVTGKDGKLGFVEEGKSDNQVLFSRFMLSTTDKSVDGLGGYSMMQGSSSFRDGGMTTAWGEVRMLEPEGIRRLAEEMVKQVRERGPFLSMSDFVNRRLEAGDKGLKGALQAAIDATDINRDFNEVEVPIARGKMFRNPKAGEGSLHTAAPGYLIQSDVLASLGNILTIRDDTFTVRSYGCVRNAAKAILAQAWCEAVVQRTMNYVDPSNDPQDSEYKPDGTKGKGLTATNKVMGRQFRIVSFKWLDNWDI